MTAEISIARRIRDLAQQASDEPVLRHIGLDGDESAFTWVELDRRSSQLGGRAGARGASAWVTASRSGCAIRQQFVLSTFAAWKLGAVPDPGAMGHPRLGAAPPARRGRPRVYLDSDDLAWIDATADVEVPELDDVTSPQVNGICSSGSTGTPKVILRATGPPHAGLRHAAHERMGPRAPPADDPRAGADVPRQRVRDAVQPPLPATSWS